MRQRLPCVATAFAVSAAVFLGAAHAQLPPAVPWASPVTSTPDATPGAASAEPPLTRRASSYRLSLGFGLKNSFMTQRQPAYRDFLAAYGYDSGGFGVIVDVVGEAAIPVQDVWELGGRVAYGTAPWDASSIGGSDLSLETLEVGVLARRVFSARVPLGLELGLGMVLPMLGLRGEVTTDQVLFWRLELCYRHLGRVGPWFQFGYMHAPWQDALADGIDLPLGGLTTAGGLSLRY